MSKQIEFLQNQVKLLSKGERCVEFNSDRVEGA